MNYKNIVDIQSDRDLGVLIKAASKLVNSDFAEEVYSMALNMEKTASNYFALERTSQFPANSPEETILSKLYFDYQHTKLAERDRRVVNDRLDTFLNLYNVPDDLFETKEEKVASREARYLLPSLETCAVHDKDELIKAGSLFVKEAHTLALKHRVEFAQEFAKTASEMEYVPYPKTIAKYAGVLDTDMNNLAYMLEVRASAASRKGRDGAPYTKLAHSLVEVEEKPSDQELSKLAKLIHRMDQVYGFDTSEYDNKLPDAFSIVFNKEADTNAPEVDKSKIVAEFGLDALEAVENEDGAINMEKLNLIKRKYGNNK